MNIKDVLHLQINYIQNDKESVASQSEYLLNKQTQVYTRISYQVNRPKLFAHNVDEKLFIYTQK